MDGHRDEVLSIDINRSGSHIISSGMDHSLKLWHLNQAKIVESYRAKPQRLSNDPSRAKIDLSEYAKSACSKKINHPISNAKNGFVVQNAGTTNHDALKGSISSELSGPPVNIKQEPVATEEKQAISTNATESSGARGTSSDFTMSSSQWIPNAGGGGGNKIVNGTHPSNSPKMKRESAALNAQALGSAAAKSADIDEDLVPPPLFPPRKKSDRFMPSRDHFPMFSTRDIHKNYIDCCAFFGQLILSKSCENEIVVWKPGKLGQSSSPSNTSTSSSNNKSSSSRQAHHNNHSETNSSLSPENEELLRENDLSLPTKFVHEAQTTVLHRFEFKDCDIWFMRFSIDRSLSKLAQGTMNGRVYIWDIESGDLAVCPK